MNSKTEDTLAIISALIVIFSALLSPPISIAISIIMLTVFGIYKFAQKQK